MICKDEIMQEVRTAREAYAGRFDYDLARMFEDLKAKEAQNPAPRASLKAQARSGSTFKAVDTTTELTSRR